ncbi:15097_t:CDS:2 [Acaulospora morrowiae]|uniref:15097_t:CDS:1 n=1 Tax=Acaulospora morrowiae TaxID=94023 RepID=A0A9N8W0H5_9GLOM|nr:15097_t:CDS:2 [Acaulospora morrowiae]
MSDSTNKIHDIAVAGFSTQTEAYEQSRPSYPPQVVSSMISSLSLVPGQSKVLDLASGTGKFTRLIIPYNFDLIAVEPSIKMRKKFMEILPEVKLMEGTAWSIPLPDEELDAVIVAQAFHWFADAAALREIARVLKPGCGLALCWNMEDREASRWVGAWRDEYEKYDGDIPQYRKDTWKKAFSLEEVLQTFTPLQHQRFHHQNSCDEKTIWQRVLSKSYITCLNEETRENLKKRLTEILKSGTDVERTEDGKIIYPYNTDLYWCFKKH